MRDGFRRPDVRGNNVASIYVNNTIVLYEKDNNSISSSGNPYDLRRAIRKFRTEGSQEVQRYLNSEIQIVQEGSEVHIFYNNESMEVEFRHEIHLRQSDFDALEQFLKI